VTPPKPLRCKDTEDDTESRAGIGSCALKLKRYQAECKFFKGKKKKKPKKTSFPNET